MAFRGVLPAAPQRPSFGTELARGLGEGFGSGIDQAVNFSQQMALHKQKSSNLAQQTKQLEKVKMMETGLGTIGRMRELLSSAGGWTSSLGNKLSSLIPNSETQRDRAELEALGRSLIPLVAAGVPVRNQKEFEEYRKIITDPNASPAQFEGALSGIQNILERSLESGEESEEKASSKNKPVFDPSNPGHRKTRDALLQKYGNNREKVAMELMKHFREE